MKYVLSKVTIKAIKTSEQVGEGIGMVMGITILNKMTRDSLTEKVTYEQRHAVGKELNPADSCGKDVVQRTTNANTLGPSWQTKA